MSDLLDIEALSLPDWVDLDRLETQRPVIEEILARYEEGNSLVILDAPVGQGKSLIAEVVRQSLRVRAIYTATTKVLQDQLAKDFTNAAIIRGRSNYEPTNPEPDTWGSWPTCGDCDWDNKTQLCSHCSDWELCPYSLAKDRARKAPLVCTNYAYLLGEANNTGNFSGREFIIGDECDQIEQEIMGFVSISISARMQKLLSLRPPTHKTVESSWVKWFDYAIERITAKFNMMRGQSLQDKRRRQAVERLLQRIGNVAANPEGFVYTGYAEGSENGRIEFKPVIVDRIAPDVFWKHGKRFLCMSATVISPEEFTTSLGYKGSWAPVFAPSTFPAERRPIYYCPSAYMTKKQEDVEKPKLAAALRVVIDRHPDERVLVHTHSYALTSFCRDALKDSDRPVFTYLNSDERQTAIDDYLDTPNAVILAPSLQRGMDFKDDMCRVIVLVKTPLPYLGDKQISTRLFKVAGGELWYATLTARTIAQSIGRGMRHVDDQVCCYILDSHFEDFYNKWKIDRCECGHRTRDHSSKGCHFGECDCTRDISKLGDHKLFAPYILDALHWDSGVRWEVNRATKTRLLNSVGPVK